MLLQLIKGTGGHFLKLCLQLVCLAFFCIKIRYPFNVGNGPTSTADFFFRFGFISLNIWITPKPWSLRIRRLLDQNKPAIFGLEIDWKKIDKSDKRYMSWFVVSWLLKMNATIRISIFLVFPRNYSICYPFYYPFPTPTFCYPFAFPYGFLAQRKISKYKGHLWQI